MATTVEWCAEFQSAEIKVLRREVFDTGPSAVEDRDWRAMVGEHSFGWVTAREDGRLVGFINVIWDGMIHAWLQDVMVSSASRHQGIATQMVGAARDACKRAGCEWLHVDFDDNLSDFYFQVCGFAPTTAGLMHLV